MKKKLKSFITIYLIILTMQRPNYELDAMISVHLIFFMSWFNAISDSIINRERYR